MNFADLLRMEEEERESRIEYAVFKWYNTSDQKSKEIEKISNVLKKVTIPTDGINQISHDATENLQKALAKMLGRKVGEKDDHGVSDFTLERDIFGVEDDEKFVFGDFIIPASVLKEQAKRYKIHFIDEICFESGITSHFTDKKDGRKWNYIFEKHFYIQTSPISILYDRIGRPLKTDLSKEENRSKKKDIFLCTAVGFDVSAHRLTGVHFADFLRFLQRTDGRSIEDVQLSYEEEYKKLKEESKQFDARETDLWDHAYDYWVNLFRDPRKMYKLDVKTLEEDYRLQFALLFSALKSEGVEVPIIASIGCGVFGNKWFPEYQVSVINAYIHVLSQNDYGFKSVCLCDVNDGNREVFESVLDKRSQELKIPLCLVKADMLVLARHLNESGYCTNIHNPGDLWEFGQFWEGRGSLEEYCARMTSGFFSQHHQVNPFVLDRKCRKKWHIDEIGIPFSFEHIQKLSEFVMHIKKDMF